MSVKDFLRTRKSTRDFKNKELSLDLLKKIETGLVGVSNDNNFEVNFDLAVDGERIFNLLDGHAGYSGKMIKSPHYVICEKMDDDKDSGLWSAYSIEDAISKISELDVASCYVTVKQASEDVRKKAFGAKYDRVEYILAIGMPNTGFLNLEQPSNPRLSIDEIVFKDEIGKSFEGEELEHRGLSEVFYYARLAPSTQNRQPWRYIVKEDELFLVTKTDEIHDNTSTDLGIQMYYFKKLSEYAGFKGEWELVTGQEIDGYKVVAKFKL